MSAAVQQIDLDKATFDAAHTLMWSWRDMLKEQPKMTRGVAKEVCWTEADHADDLGWVAVQYLFATQLDANEDVASALAAFEREDVARLKALEA